MTTTILRLHRLNKRFGGLAVSDNVTLDIAQGEVHALIGPNGAGKTTLIHQISGALAADSGRIEFAGRDITSMPMHERVMRGIVRSFQVSTNFKRFSVLDNIALAVQAHTGSSMQFWKPARAEAERYAEARKIAERVGLAPRLHVLAGALAHGEQRQLELAFAFATRPAILLLDEPMAGMGPAEAQQMIELLFQLRGDTTIVLVEHDMDAVFILAQRISVLVAGRIVATGSPAEIRADVQVQQAYLGEDLHSETGA